MSFCSVKEYKREDMICNAAPPNASYVNNEFDHAVKSFVRSKIHANRKLRKLFGGGGKREI